MWWAAHLLFSTFSALGFEKFDDNMFGGELLRVHLLRSLLILGTYIHAFHCYLTVIFSLSIPSCSFSFYFSLHPLRWFVVLYLTLFTFCFMFISCYAEHLCILEWYQLDCGVQFFMFSRNFCKYFVEEFCFYIAFPPLFSSSCPLSFSSSEIPTLCILVYLKTSHPLGSVHFPSDSVILNFSLQIHWFFFMSGLPLNLCKASLPCLHYFLAPDFLVFFFFLGFP